MSMAFKEYVCVAVLNCTTIQTLPAYCAVLFANVRLLNFLSNVCEIISNWLEETKRSHIRALLLGIYGTHVHFCMIIIKLDVGIVSYVRQRSVT